MVYGFVRLSVPYQNGENRGFEVAKSAQKCGFSIDKWVIETAISLSLVSE